MSATAVLSHTIVGCLILVILSTPLPADQMEVPMPLPEGHSGIASRYAGDAGIADDPSVVFAESFEGLSDVDELDERWESVRHKELMSIQSDVPEGSAGRQSLLTSHVGGESNGADLYTRLLPGYDKLHFRFYTKFDPDCNPIHHFARIGGRNPSTPGPRGGAGVRPGGNERFSFAVEPHGSRWVWDYYTYWMEMGGSPPEGKTWGNSFVHNDSITVKRGEWTSVEIMVKLNQDVEGHDGEMAMWIEGKLVSHLGPGFPKGMWTYDKFKPGRSGTAIRWNDELEEGVTYDVPEGGNPFDGFRWRSSEDLTINYVWLQVYITRAPNGHLSKVYYDDIVIAKEYIGPIRKGH